MHLLELGSERVSLEFSRTEWPAILARLGTLGRTTRAQQATHDLVRVNGAEFILMDEWDQPCLISQSAQGDAILRSVAENADDVGARRVGENVSRFDAG